MNPVSSLASRMLEWLRQGYPHGLRAKDTYAVLYVLERELNDDDLEKVFTAMIEASEKDPQTRNITREDIAKHIEFIHRQAPCLEDIDHVRELLKEAGFKVTSTD